MICPITSRERPFPTSVIPASHVRSIDTLARPIRYVGALVGQAVAQEVRAKLWVESDCASYRLFRGDHPVIQLGTPGLTCGGNRGKRARNPGQETQSRTGLLRARCRVAGPRDRILTIFAAILEGAALPGLPAECAHQVAQRANIRLLLARAGLADHASPWACRLGGAGIVGVVGISSSFRRLQLRR